MQLTELQARLEAILIVTEEPVTTAHFSEVFDEPVETLGTALAELARSYETEPARGIRLRESSEGWQFYSSPEFADDVEKFVRSGQHAKLTQAALETLAIVAYRQPMTRGQIAAIRGVNVDGVVRTLVNRQLLTEVGTQEGSGALLYATTETFLHRLGIATIDELPPLAPYLPDLDALTELEDETHD